MDILDKFIENAKKSVSEGYYGIESMPESEHKKSSLKKTIESRKFTLITEIKHASPAGEYSFDNIDVEKTAFEFRKCGADAISVVVEPKIFKGDLRNVAVAKKAGLPVLFKDFVFCEHQILAAKNVGADAILLVVKVAERTGADLNELIDLAHKNELEVLLETYDADEMNAAISTDADVLGINNRDLRTLKVDLNRTKEILEQFGEMNKLVISESGIKTAEDVRFVKGVGASGALVGTAIWKAQNIGEKISELKSGAI